MRPPNFENAEPNLVHSIGSIFKTQGHYWPQVEHLQPAARQLSMGQQSARMFKQMAAMDATDAMERDLVGGHTYSLPAIGFYKHPDAGFVVPLK